MGILLYYKEIPTRIMINACYNAWFHIQQSLALQLIVASGLLLIGAVAVKIWIRLAELRESDGKNAKSHASLDLLKVILATFLASATLLVICLQTLKGLPPFDGPYQFMYLIILFILTTVLSILAEIRWEHGREYPAAFMLGTAIAFLFLAMKFNIPSNTPVHSVALLTLLLLSGYLTKRMFFPHWADKAKVLCIVTFLGWVLLYLPHAT